MADDPDLEDLARRYVELWQQHVASAAADPETNAAMTRMLQTLSRGLGASATLWQNWWLDAGMAGSNTHGARATASGGSPPRADGTEAAAASFDDGGGYLARIEARLAALEKRLAGIEARIDAAASAPRRRPRRGRPV